MAPFALLLWPFVAIFLYARLGSARGLIWSVLVGYLFLPEAIAIDLPGLPPYDKSGSIALGALLGTFIYRKKAPVARKEGSRPFTILLTCLFILLLGSPFATFITNPEALVTGDVVRPAISLSDTRAVLTGLFTLFVPFFLAYWYLNTSELHREFLFAIVVLGLLYGFLALFEIHMSPQLNTWIYGYFQHSWEQHERGSSYRPIVFLRHGLWLGFFLFTVAMAAIILSYSKLEHRTRYLLIALWILILLILSRNLGATTLGLLAAPLLLLLSPRLKIRLAAGIAACFLLYPVLFSTGMSPANRILEWTATFAPERADSFAFRLANEERLLERAMEKPVFGWGTWGRPRVFNENGVDLSVSDGIWIVVIGERGWAGYVALFGLLTLAIFFLSMRAKARPPSPEVAGIALIMGANFMYMIPNSTLSPIGLMMCGILASSVRFRTVENTAAPDCDPSPRRPRYTRFTRPIPTDPLAANARSRGLERYRRS